MATVTALFILFLLSTTTNSQCGIVSNTIVFDYNITSLIRNSWRYCYFAPYSEATTSSSFDSCPPSDDYFIFVGASQDHSVNASASLGAFAPSSILHTETTSQSIAYRPSNLEDDSNYTVYWYNVPGYSFGFSSIDDILLTPGQGDQAVWNAKSRLSWNLDGSGGYSVGEIRGTITSDDIWYKLVLYKYCQSVLPPTGMCQMSVNGMCD